MPEALLTGPPGERGDAIAVVDGDLRITYRDLRTRVRRLASGLLGLGLQPGDRVIDLQKNAHSYIETDLAMLQAGLVRVPLNHRLSGLEKRHVATDSGARACIFGGEFAEAADDLRRSVDGLGTLIAVDGGPGVSYDSVLHDGRADPLPFRATPDTLVSLNYSSGTTGLPKGCMRTWRNRLVSLQAMLLAAFERPLGPDDVWLHAGPITHASGLFVLPHLAVGATQVVLRDFEPDAALRLIEREGVTGTVLVPTMLERVVERVQPTHTLPRLRRVIYAGAPMAPDRILVADQALRGRLTQMYGMVEAIPPISILSQEDHRDAAAGVHVERLASAGRVVLTASAVVVGADDQPVPPGEVGELLIRGDHVTGGYWGGDGAAKRIVDGALRTGDMVRMDEEGYLTMVGRRGDMIISGGYNVFPSEVESVIAALPGVADVAVVGVPDATWGQAVTACVVPRGPAGETLEAAIAAACRTRLASYKLPKRVAFLPALPKGATGKTLRASVLRELTADGGQA
jgi:acyl-CoA synthetase (AMP-forming)/AMP-acid ligase II